MSYLEMEIDDKRTIYFIDIYIIKFSFILPKWYLTMKHYIYNH